MEAPQAQRPQDHGSRTLTVAPTHDAEGAVGSVSPPESGTDTASSVGVLRLRGGPVRRQRVVWSAETVDNEHMGKKKSKICCIYHKPRRFDESSSESESCSGDENDGPCSHADKPGGSSQRARPVGGGGQAEVDSSESDGGGGDGRARPARRPRRKPHSHAPKANKYDLPPSADTGKQ